jgi:hypothetical protein
MTSLLIKDSIENVPRDFFKSSGSNTTSERRGKLRKGIEKVFDKFIQPIKFLIFI